MLRSVDPSQLTQVLTDLLTRVRAEKRVEDEQMHVIVDGKTLRGTQEHLAEDQKKMHHVNLYEAKTGVVLKEQMVAEKEGELTQAEAFLTPLLLAGRILSADALYTHKHVCQQIIASGGITFSLSRGTNPPCWKIYASFLVSLLSIVWIGARTPRSKKNMGDLPAV